MSHLTCDASGMAVVQPIFPEESLVDLLTTVANRCGDDDARHRILEAIPLLNVKNNGHSESFAVFKLLDYLKDTANTRAHVWALLALMGRMEVSEAELGRRMSLSRAAISKVFCRVRDYFDEKPVLGRSDESRARFARERHGRIRPKRKASCYPLQSLMLALSRN